MVRFLIFSHLLILTFSTRGQKIFELNLETEDTNIARSVADYSKSKCITCNLIRLQAIDSVASLRVSYFLKVLKQSQKNKNLNDLLNEIPRGKLAHKRFFGNPYFFSEPDNLIYPDNLIFVPSIESKIKAEIMQQVFLAVVSSKSISPDSLIEKTLNYYKELDGSDFILKSYKASADHHNAIIRYGKNKMGTSTKAIISQKWMEERKKWKYEILIYNVVLFAE